MSTLPHWDLTTIYPSLTSPEFERAVTELRTQIAALSLFLHDQAGALPADAPPAQVAPLLAEVVVRLNGVLETESTIETYISCHVSTDSHDDLARRKLSEFESVGVEAEKLRTRFRAWVGSLRQRLGEILALEPVLTAHEFPLTEIAGQARFQMSEAEESLAAELALSGANAWNKLQRTITSQLTVPFSVDGEEQQMPMPALINLRTHPDEDVRRRAYEAENRVWDTVREPLAAALNGIKGAVNTLDKRRGREDSLHSALEANRIDRATLDAMFAAMQDSFPTFRRYFRAKAARLGKEQLAWWDIFAPVGAVDRTYDWAEAREFVFSRFASFSPAMAAYAERCFASRWIDAEPREGKVGGAFCTSVPGVKQTRVLVNFDGTSEQVSTLAHELGHAWHDECIFQMGRTPLQAQVPMTLAETASIFCETIVANAELAAARTPADELVLLEGALCGEAQVIVDIYSRFLFEQEVFERRREAELSADELCEIMERAQDATYGDALDPRYRQKYMWTWKPHYYYAGLAYYNFPYAFGQLFGIGLYALYEERGPSFVADYNHLLATTGDGDAAELAARFGVDLRSRTFWDNSIAVIGRRVERYCAL